jgi:hypothetical protein
MHTIKSNEITKHGDITLFDKVKISKGLRSGTNGVISKIVRYKFDGKVVFFTVKIAEVQSVVLTREDFERL